MNINDLVEKSKKGDIKSFVALMEARKSSIYKIAFTYMGNSYDAEDCISDASIKAFDKIHQLKNNESFYTWFISILINVCRSSHRKKNTIVPYDESLYNIRAEFFEASIENKAIIDNIFETLKEDERDILVLRYMKDFKITEIAQIMKIPEATLKTKLYRLLNKIKKENKAVEI